MRYAMKRRTVGMSLVGALACSLMTVSAPVASKDLSVIVLDSIPGSGAAARAVDRVGGRRGVDLPLIGGIAAHVSSSEVPVLARLVGVRGVMADPMFRLNGSVPSTPSTIFTQAVDAPKAWAKGYCGKVGVNVGILDSGIAPHDDLAKTSNRIVGWTDLVGGSATPVDPYGHGTYLAGVVAGNGTASAGKWKGIAPCAGVVGIRVFDALGLAPASRVIQGIQWAITNKTTYSIKVLNMSFSSVATLSYKLDAVAYAAEQAWKAGIVVVASAGNLGPLPGTIQSPGFDPYVITVGAIDDVGTVSRTDDRVTDFSGHGPTLIDLLSKPDLAAPGVWDTALRAPGSTIDVAHPASIVDTSYFQGSGTSPATAVVSGVVALMLQRRATLKPDQVKYVLTHTTTAGPGTDAMTIGAGTVNAYNATMSTLTSSANVLLVSSVGGALPLSIGLTDVKWR